MTEQEIFIPQEAIEASKLTPVEDTALSPVTPNQLAITAERTTIHMEKITITESANLTEKESEENNIVKPNDLGEKPVDASQTPNEQKEEGEKLEEGFATIEAQKAWHEYMDALYDLNFKTGEGMERVEEAMKGIHKHALEMSIDRVVSVLTVTIKALIHIMANSEEEKMVKPEEENETSEQKKNPKEKMDELTARLLGMPLTA